MSRFFAFLTLGSVVMLAFAAPVPQAPDEDLRTWKSKLDFDDVTLNRGSPKSTESLSRGERITTAKGWYATYNTDAGVMVLSTIPDGRMKYGYFDHWTGQTIAWNDGFAPGSCIGCHNKNRAR